MHNSTDTARNNIYYGSRGTLSFDYDENVTSSTKSYNVDLGSWPLHHLSAHDFVDAN